MTMASQQTAIHQHAASSCSPCVHYYDSIAEHLSESVQKSIQHSPVSVEGDDNALLKYDTVPWYCTSTMCIALYILVFSISI